MSGGGLRGNLLRIEENGITKVTDFGQLQPSDFWELVISLAKEVSEDLLVAV